MKKKNQPRGWKTAAVREYLKKNPDASHKDFLKETGVDVVDAVFYTERKKMTGGVLSQKRSGNGNSLIPPDYIIQDKMKSTYESLVNFLYENQEATHTQMKKELGVKIAESTYRRFKQRCVAYWKKSGIKKIRSYRTAKKKASLYHPIFTVDCSNLSEESKDLLKQFVESLNETKVGKYEVREYMDPREIEVREVQ